MNHTSLSLSICYNGVSLQQCATRFPDEINDLYNCGVSEEGYQLFLDAGRRQQELAPVVTEVPLVALNEVNMIFFCVCVYFMCCL